MDIEDTLTQTNDLIQQFESRGIVDEVYDELKVLQKSLGNATSDNRKIVMFLIVQDIFRSAREKLSQ